MNDIIKDIITRLLQCTDWDESFNSSRPLPGRVYTDRGISLIITSGGCTSPLVLVTCIPRVDITTISIALFMYVNEVGANRALHNLALPCPSIRQKMRWFIAYFVKQVCIIEQNTGKYLVLWKTQQWTEGIHSCHGNLKNQIRTISAGDMWKRTKCRNGRFSSWMYSLTIIVACDKKCMSHSFPGDIGVLTLVTKSNPRF